MFLFFNHKKKMSFFFRKTTLVEVGNSGSQAEDKSQWARDSAGRVGVWNRLLLLLFSISSLGGSGRGGGLGGLGSGGDSLGFLSFIGGLGGGGRGGLGGRGAQGGGGGSGGRRESLAVAVDGELGGVVWRSGFWDDLDGVVVVALELGGWGPGVGSAVWNVLWRM